MLFTRSDGEAVRGLSPLRRIVPYLMRGRNESVVYFEQILDLGEALPFIERWNAEHPQSRITVFHLALAAFARTLHARPGLNRFVASGRIWQRRGVWMSFAAKRAFDDDAPLVTVKMEFPPGESFAEMVRRVHERVGEGRSGRERPVDKEVRLALLLPGFVLRAAFALLRFLDRWNLMPSAMIANDPMYASLFAANLGSVGIDRAWHHLYEHGTVSLFAAIGVAGRSVVVGPDGQPAVRPTVRIRYAFDERINDGFYCVKALDVVRECVERPDTLLSAT